jgi:hypothetical protein
LAVTCHYTPGAKHRQVLTFPAITQQLGENRPGFPARPPGCPPSGDSKEDQQDSSANSGKDLQNPQPPRNKESADQPGTSDDNEEKH